MGLLIGASVITLCEVLDLFIYNTFIKLNGRKNHIKYQPEKQLNDRKSSQLSTIAVDGYVPSKKEGYEDQLDVSAD